MSVRQAKSCFISSSWNQGSEIMHGSGTVGTRSALAVLVVRANTGIKHLGAKSSH